MQKIPTEAKKNSTIKIFPLSKLLVENKLD